MNALAWLNGVDVAVTVCDCDGVILFMNGKSTTVFAADGGKDLLGKNLMACHPEPARRKIRRLIQTGEANSYTIKKNGVKKLIHQAPWHRDGKVAGLVEFSIVIPAVMPHFVRG